MRACLLASGSKGNALVVDTGRTRLLVDAGLSARELCRRLELVAIDPGDLDAVVISHEHTDHVRGLGPLVRRLDLPVYLHTEVASILPDVGRAEKVAEFDTRSAWSIGDLSLRAFPVTHDATAPVGFVIETAERKLGVVTDLGTSTRLVKDALTDCHGLVLETNHDEVMLRDGPYPWPLKQRVRGSHGHLSNRDGSSLLEALAWDGLSSLMLAHLSETNNLPELALATVTRCLEGQNSCAPDVVVGEQDTPTGWMNI